MDLKPWQMRAKELKFVINKSWTVTYKTLQEEYPTENLQFAKMRSFLKRQPEYQDRSSTMEINHVDRHRKTVMIFNGDGTYTGENIIKASDKEINDQKYLLTAHGFNPEEWELAWAKNSVYNVQIKGGFVDTFYASKITVKPRTTPDPEQMLKYFREQAAQYSPVLPRAVTYKNKGKLSVINITDLHLGQLSWAPESGENYDHKIATRNMKTIVEDIEAKSVFYEYDKIVLIFGNDFFNSDNIQGSTTKGTQQFNDIRWPKMYKAGCELLVWTIDSLRQRFPDTEIDVLLIPGNHSYISEYAAALHLWAWFHKDKSVHFEIEPTGHKGFAFGNTALLFTHGQNELKNMDWVYTEFRHLMAGTKVTEIHAGHGHRIHVEEKNGAIINRNPTPSALSAWAYNEGWNSVRQAVTRIYDKDDGLIHEIYSKV